MFGFKKLIAAMPSINQVYYVDALWLQLLVFVTIYVLSRYFCDGRKLPSDGAIDNDTDANGYCKASPILMHLDRCSPDAWQSSFTIETFLLPHFFGQSCVELKLLYGIKKAHISIHQVLSWSFTK